MMRLPPFAYLRPRSLGEATELLAKYEQAAALVAGGTDLYPNMKRRQVAPGVLVSLRGVTELRGIQERDGTLAIGAATTLHEMATHIAVRGSYPALARAAALVSSPQIRNMGTLGGNLCMDTRCAYYDHPEGWRSAIGYCLKAGSGVCRLAPGGARCWAVSSSDLAPVVIALEAEVRLVSAEGERVIPATALYADDGASYLAKTPREIVAEVLLPAAGGTRASYWKLRQRGSIDFPLLGVAAAVTLEPPGVCTRARIVLGAVGSRPVRATEAERVLVGKRLVTEVMEAAGEAAAQSVKPMENADLTPAYRKRMAAVYLRRALAELAAVRETAR